MNEIAKRTVEAVLPKYRLIEWIFEDQFWNKVKWVLCPCWVPGIEHKFKYYSNYWGKVVTKYACDKCLDDWGQDHRVNRDKRIVIKWSYNRR